MSARRAYSACAPTSPRRWASTPKEVHVLTGQVGGSFGMKAAVFPEYICLLHAARALGRPVKWTDERSGSFVSDSHGRDHEVVGELALDEDGNFLAVRSTASPIWARSSRRWGRCRHAQHRQERAGHVPHAADRSVDQVRVHQHLAVSAYRGAGRPEGNYYMERLIDAAAAEMGIDRVALRRRNQIRRHELPYKTASGSHL